MKVLTRQVVWRHLEQLNALENQMFGPDFECSLDEIAHWISSRAFEYVVLGEERNGALEVGAFGSTLLVGRRQIRALQEGTIRENDLIPFGKSMNETSFVYFSSLYSKVPGGARVIMRQLVSRSAPSEPQGILAISCTEHGEGFLKKYGFIPKASCYLGKYRFYAIDGPNWPSAIIRRQLKSLPCSFDSPKRYSPVAGGAATESASHEVAAS